MKRDDYFAIQREIEGRLESQRCQHIADAKKARKKAKFRLLLLLLLDIIAFIVLIEMDRTIPTVPFVLLLMVTMLLIPFSIYQYLRTKAAIRAGLRDSIASDQFNCQQEFNKRVFDDHLRHLLFQNGFRPFELPAVENESDDMAQTAMQSLNFYGALYQNRPYGFCTLPTYSTEQDSYPCVEMPAFRQLDNETDIMISRRHGCDLMLEPLNNFRKEWYTTDEVNVDNSTFANLFEVRSGSAFHTFKILVPALMEKILELDSRCKIMYLSFRNDRTTICLAHPVPTFFNEKEGFDAGLAMQTAEEKANVLIELMKKITFLGRKITE